MPSQANNSRDSEVAKAVAGGEKVCPRCAETVKAAALICRYCKYVFGMPLHRASLVELVWSSTGQVLAKVFVTILILIGVGIVFGGGNRSNAPNPNAPNLIVRSTSESRVPPNGTIVGPNVESARSKASVPSTPNTPTDEDDPNLPPPATYTFPIKNRDAPTDFNGTAAAPQHPLL